jgi:protease IV
MNGSRQWRIGIIILALLFFAGIGLMILLGIYSYASKKEAMESVFAHDRIAVVRIENVIMTSEAVVKRLEDLRNDASVKGIVLRLNSPGGGVAASQEIYEEVKACKKAGKRIVSSMSSVAASGAYYIACASDTVVANPGTITGSIGVIFQFPYIKDLFDKIGVSFEVVKSGQYKDAGSAHRKITPEERKLFQGLIDDTWMQFVEAVADGRHMQLEAVKKVADGRIFTGRQAKDAGLVDVLGTFEDAKVLTKRMCGLPDDALIREFEPRKKLMDWIAGDVDGLFGKMREKAGLSGIYYLYSE